MQENFIGKAILARKLIDEVIKKDCPHRAFVVMDYDKRAKEKRMHEEAK